MFYQQWINPRGILGNDTQSTYMGVSKNRGTPNGWLIMENRKTLLKWMIWGVPIIFGNTHIYIFFMDGLHNPSAWTEKIPSNPLFGKAMDAGLPTISSLRKGHFRSNGPADANREKMGWCRSGWGEVIRFLYVLGWWQLKYFVFSPRIPGEMIHFDEDIFQMGWNHQPGYQQPKIRVNTTTPPKTWEPEPFNFSSERNFIFRTSRFGGFWCEFVGGVEGFWHTWRI